MFLLQNVISGLDFNHSGRSKQARANSEEICRGWIEYKVTVSSFLWGYSSYFLCIKYKVYIYKRVFIQRL